MLRVRLTSQADADIGDLLRATKRLFGVAQVASYARLITRTIELVAADPERPGARSRLDLGDGVRSLHVERVAGRRGGASHQVFSTASGAAETGPSELLVLRVLHESMDPGRRVEAALRDDVTRSSRRHRPRSPGR